MNESPKSRTVSALIYLTSCELNGIKPQLPEDIDAKEVFRAAVYHGMGALAASALSKIGLANDEMTSHLHASIRKIMLLDAERAALCHAFSTAGIWHMPLKGVILKELYPSIGLRQMSDNDILFDSDKREAVRAIFEQRGYTVSAYGGRTDDVYMKEPLYNYEMHVALFSELESERFREYFLDAYQRSLPADEGGYLRRMTDEDFYIYMKAHEHKHYSHGGVGLRSLADTYLFIRAFGDKMDAEHLDSELSSLGISEYERETRSLALKLLSPEGASALMSSEPELDERERELLSYLFSSGTYGTVKNLIRNDIQKRKGRFAGVKYVMSRLFPPMEWYRAYAPFYYEHKILIPFYIVKRIFLKVILAPGRVISELSKVNIANKANKAKGKKRNAEQNDAEKK